jgi:hypothetical protein
MTGDVAVYLGPLLTDPSRIRREAVRRRKPFDEMSVSADAIPDHEAKGWQVDRKLKRLTKVKREKEVDGAAREQILDASFQAGLSRTQRWSSLHNLDRAEGCRAVAQAG